MKISLLLNTISLIIILIFSTQLSKSQTWQELHDSTTYYFEINDYNTSLVWAKKALIQAETEFGKNDTNYTNTLDDIASASYLISDYPNALKFTMEEYKQLRDIFIGDHELIASTLDDIGYIYNVMGKSDTALVYHAQSLEMYQRLYPVEEYPYGIIIMSQVLTNMARIYQNNMLNMEAEKSFRSALEIKRHFLGKSSSESDLNDLSSSLNEFAFFYTNLGDYPEALSLFLEAYEYLKKAYPNEQYPEGHSSIATILNNIGDSYQKMGDFTNAEIYLKNALNMKQILFEKNSNTENLFDLLLAEHNLAVLYYSQTKFDSTESSALNILQRIDQHDDSGINIQLIVLKSSAYNLLGSLYDEQAKYKAAEDNYTQSLELYRSIFTEAFFPMGFAEISDVLNNLAIMYQKTGMLIKAENHYMEALGIKKRMYPEDKYPNGHPVIAKLLGNLAVLHRAQGRYHDAESAYIESLDMYRNFYNKEMYPNGHPDLVTVIENVSVFYHTQGMSGLAEKLLKESLEMNIKLYPEKDYPNGHYNLGFGYFTIGNFYLENDSLSLAEEYLAKAGSIFNKVFPESDYPKGHPLYISFNLNLSYLSYLVGDYKKALEYAGKSLDIAKSLYPKNEYPSGHPELCLAMIQMANLLEDTGENKQAEKLYLESMAYNSQLFPDDLYPNGNVIIADNYSDMAIYYHHINKLKKAKEYWLKSLDIYVKQIVNQFPYMTEKEKENFWSNHNITFKGFNSFAITNMKDDQPVINMLYNHTLLTKGLLLSSAKKITEKITNSSDTNLIELYSKWQGIRFSLLNYYKLTANQLIEKGIDLDSLEQVANYYEKQLAILSASFKHEYDKEAYTWKDVKSKLKNNEAAVEIIRITKFGRKHHEKNPLISFYSRTDTVLYAALIVTPKTKKGPELVILNYGNALENNFIIEYQRLVKLQKKGTYNEPYFNRKLKELYEKFWQPISSELSGSKTVYISLDGVYNVLNLNTLISPDKNIYLQDEYDLRIVPSTRSVIESKGKITDTINKAILLGNPKFDLDSTEYQEVKERLLAKNDGDGLSDDDMNLLAMRAGITELPGTKEEVEKIASNMLANNWSVDKYVQEDAVEEAIKAADNPRILHIASHGKFLTDIDFKRNILTFGIRKETYIENPLLRSYIVLAGGEKTLFESQHQSGDNDDGLLTAYEAQNLKLDNTELVVLSACETGLGEIRNGEGVYGLQRAFLVAGADAVIISLWQVNDQSTSDLMTSFYDYWLSGMNKMDAFKKAQNDIREKYPGFYHWGSFVIVGD